MSHAKVHAMMVAAAVSSQLRGGQQSANLKGTLSDKIHVEDFCYNYQNYILHPTIQLSEEAEVKQLEPVDSKHVGNQLTGQRKSNTFSEEPSVSGQSKDEFQSQRIQREVERRLREFFNRKSDENCILFLTGHGKRGTGELFLNQQFGAVLSFYNLVNYWDQRESGEVPWTLEEAPKRLNHLFIVIDSCHSGRWVQILKGRLRRSDISVQASCLNWQQSFDAEGTGGFFLNNFLHLNGLKDLKYSTNYKAVVGQRTIERQTPTAYSSFANLERVFRIKANFNSWEQMEWRTAKSMKGTFISEDGDVITGEFKSVQLHGLGEKKLANGRYEQGFFVNDKLTGSGVVRWDQFECKGMFEQGRLVGDFEARLSNGHLVTQKGPIDGLEAQRFNFAIDDDFLMESENLNDSGRTWARIKYVNSQSFEGFSIDDSRQGFGIHTWPTGEIYAGIWEDGVPKESVSGKKSAGAPIVEGGVGKVPRFNRASIQCMKDFTKEAFVQPSKWALKVGPLWKLSAEHWLTFKRLADGSYQNKYNERFEGSWSERGPDGKGRFDDRFGQTFRGEWKAGLPNGEGVFIGPSGLRYSGGWLAGKRHGFGSMILGAAGTYVGEFKFDRMIGRGCLRKQNGERIEGSFLWEMDNQSGIGCRLTLNGNVYKGELMRGEESGKGEMVYGNGDVYSGEFKAGLRSGFGKLKRHDGEEYEGQFKNDNYEGKGRLKLANGQVYESMFVEGNMVVNAKFRLTEGEVYEGEALTVRFGFDDGNYENDNEVRIRVREGGESTRAVEVPERTSITREGKSDFVRSLKRDKQRTTVVEFSESERVEKKSINSEFWNDNNWIFAEKHGKGTLTKVNGETVVGQWSHDVPTKGQLLDIDFEESIQRTDSLTE